MNATIYIIGFCITIIAVIIFAGIIGEDFFDDFLPMSLGGILVAFIWPAALFIAILMSTLGGIWLLIRAEDLHRNIWEWVKKVWVKI